MINGSGSGSGSATAGVSMAIGCSVVSSAFSTFFRFLFVDQLVLRLRFVRGADEERGTGGERDFMLLGLVTRNDNSLPDRRHIADMEVRFIGSSTTSERAAIESTGSQYEGSMGPPMSWGGVGGGASSGSIFSSWGVE